MNKNFPRTLGDLGGADGFRSGNRPLGVELAGRVTRRRIAN